jgi:hypothetical protein
MKPAILAGLAFVLSGVLSAQWINHPTPGIPRAPDGKPNLAAPAPRAPDGKPDLSGIWGYNAGAYAMNIAADLRPEDIQPWAQALYKQRMEDLAKDDPVSYQCLPDGPRANFNPFLMSKIIQTSGLIVVLSEALSYRQIFTDGRQLPQDPNPSYMGYSIGHWEGDTLVVESTGFNEKLWLDGGGHPLSESLKITERYRRRDFGHMDVEQTIEDPKIYAKPVTFPVKLSLIPDTELIEFLCNENERDAVHLVGKASDDRKKAVQVARDILAQYVGSYEFQPPENPTNLLVTHVSLTGEELFLDFEGKDKTALIPLSETVFSLLGDRIQFIKDERGAVTHYISFAAEGDLKSTRIPDGK